VARETVERLREDELLFLGMKKINEDSKDPNSAAYQFNLTREKRKALQSKYEGDYNDGLLSLKDEIKKNEESDIKEALMEERRQWVRDYTALFEKNQLPKNVKEFYKWNEVAKPLSPEEEEAQRKEEEDKKKEAKKKKDAKKAGKGKKSKKDSPV
jgi:hypothetical protein